MVWTSLFGIITIVLLARAMGFARTPRLADAAEAGRIAGDAVHGFQGLDAALSADRRAALVAGGDGRVALVRPFGDRWVVRIVNGARAEVRGGLLRLKPDEAMFSPVVLDLGPAAAVWAGKL